MASPISLYKHCNVGCGMFLAECPNEEKVDGEGEGEVDEGDEEVVDEGEG